MPERPDAASITKILRSDRSLSLLNRLHLHRLRAPSETVSMSLQEAALQTFDEQRARQPTEAQQKTIACCLHETWLPRMDNCGMLSYDTDEHVVVATPATTLFTLLIQPDRLDERDLENVASACAWIAWQDAGELL